MSNNTIIKNILTDAQRQTLFNIIEQENKLLRIEKGTGRSRLEFYPLNPKVVIPKDIVDSIKTNINANQDTLILESCYFSCYSLDYGTPKLAPHLDNHSSQYTIDYCLDANCIWPVVVEGKEFEIPVNGALTIDTNRQFHWRKPKLFNQNEYVKMIFFHFTDNTRDVVPIDIVNKNASGWRRIFDQQTELLIDVK